MVKKRPEYLVYFLEDCLQGDNSFSIKHMFGGYAIYKYEKVFALFIDDTIYFKVGDNNRDSFEQYNSKPFTYTKKTGKVGVMSYRILPEEILENREELESWIELSLEVPSKTKKKSKKVDEMSKKILESLLEIPSGKVTTYKNIALQFQVHPRKVAQTMRYNKEPLKYPCYKVIASTGKISGYNTDRGVIEKIEKLEADGIKIVGGKVSEEFIT